MTADDVLKFLTSATPVAGDVGDVANFGTALIKLIQPSITDNEIQSLNDQLQADMRESANQLAIWQSDAGDPDHDRAFGNYAQLVCSNAGFPFAGGVAAGPLVGVRVGFVLTALCLANTVKNLRAQLAKNAAAVPEGKQ